MHFVNNCKTDKWTELSSAWVTSVHGSSEHFEEILLFQQLCVCLLYSGPCIGRYKTSLFCRHNDDTAEWVLRLLLGLCFENNKRRGHSQPIFGAVSYLKELRDPELRWKCDALRCASLRLRKIGCAPGWWSWIVVPTNLRAKISQCYLVENTFIVLRFIAF